MKRSSILLVMLLMFFYAYSNITYTATSATSVNDGGWYLIATLVNSHNYVMGNTLKGDKAQGFGLMPGGNFLDLSRTNYPKTGSTIWEIADYRTADNSFLMRSTVQNQDGTFKYIYSDNLGIYLGDEQCRWTYCGNHLIPNGNTLGIQYTSYFTIATLASQNSLITMHQLYATGITAGDAVNKSLAAQNSEGYWATFSHGSPVLIEAPTSPYAIVYDNDVLKFVRFEKAAVRDESSNIHMGYLVPANTGVLLHSTSNECHYYVVSGSAVSEIVPVSNNLLQPANTMPEEGTTDAYYFKLAYGVRDSQSDLGWYWGNEEGAAFSVNTGTAYLRLPKNLPANALQSLILTEEMIANAEEITTGMDNTEEDEVLEPTGMEPLVDGETTSEGLYDLLGRPVAYPQSGQIYIQGKRKILFH